MCVTCHGRSAAVASRLCHLCHFVEVCTSHHFETQTKVPTNAEAPESQQLATVRLWHDGQILSTLSTALGLSFDAPAGRRVTEPANGRFSHHTGLLTSRRLRCEPTLGAKRHLQHCAAFAQRRRFWQLQQQGETDVNWSACRWLQRQAWNSEASGSGV